jgi:hypothetical protein
MAQKGSTSKRSNGAAKPATQPKPKGTKARTRKTAAVPLPEVMSEEEIALKAYFLWESRGRPIGSPDEDWHKAKEQLGA